MVSEQLICLEARVPLGCGIARDLSCFAHAVASHRVRQILYWQYRVRADGADGAAAPQYMQDTINVTWYCSATAYTHNWTTVYPVCRTMVYAYKCRTDAYRTESIIAYTFTVIKLQSHPPAITYWTTLSVELCSMLISALPTLTVLSP